MYISQFFYIQVFLVLCVFLFIVIYHLYIFLIYIYHIYSNFCRFITTGNKLTDVSCVLIVENIDYNCFDGYDWSDAVETNRIDELLLHLVQFLKLEWKYLVKKVANITFNITFKRVCLNLTEKREMQKQTVIPVRGFIIQFHGDKKENKS